MKTIQVQTSNPYQIFIHHNINYGEIVKKFINTEAIIIHDSHIPHSKITEIQKSLKDAQIPHKTLHLKQTGEELKTFKSFEETAKILIEEYSVTRKTLLIALGGGTVGDFIGFVASSLMRGIPFIQIPTTLLSMVDSSVGGKVAINLGQYKNCIGAFYQPKAVIIDTSFLCTLPETELLSGYAEVIKYGFIQDKNFYNYLIKNTDIFVNFIKEKKIASSNQDYLTHIISHSCEIKAEVVSQDEHETTGIREILNFGHTFGHAFEGIFLGKLPHGIAVAIGIIYALRYSKINTDAILQHYKNIGMPSSIEEFCQNNGLKTPSTEEIFNLMKKDKKNTNTNIKLILLREIGNAFTREESEENVLNFLNSH